jgi:AcrR family transcriptional regulator
MNGREKILLSALRLFADNGFDGVSVRTIAEQAGVSFGLVWKCFGPKEALRAAVDEYVVNALDKVNQHSISRQEPSLMQAIAVEDPTLVVQHAVELRYLRRALLEYGPASAQMFSRYFEAERSFFQSLKEKGEIRADIDMDMLVMTSIYIGLGPLLLEPYFKETFGADILDTAIHDRRKRFVFDLLKRGAGT